MDTNTQCPKHRQLQWPCWYMSIRRPIVQDIVVHRGRWCTCYDWDGPKLNKMPLFFFIFIIIYFIMSISLFICLCIYLLFIWVFTYLFIYFIKLIYSLFIYLHLFYTHFFSFISFRSQILLKAIGQKGSFVAQQYIAFYYRSFHVASNYTHTVPSAYQTTRYYTKLHTH